MPIDEIARRAGVGAGTVYRHFPTKEALFGAIAANRLRHLVDRAAAFTETKEPGERSSPFWTSSSRRDGRTEAW